jgi:Sigma-70 factor, region 1.
MRLEKPPIQSELYMREMGTIELLDREGEIVIAKKIEDGNK